MIDAAPRDADGVSRRRCSQPHRLRHPDRAWGLATRSQGLEGKFDRHADGASNGAEPSLAAARAWPHLKQAADEFRRVTFPAEFLNSEEALVFARRPVSGPDVTEPGYSVFTPARLSAGSIVLVNRGFVPEGRQDPNSRSHGEISGPVDIVGVMRWPDDRAWFTPTDDPTHNLWFSRDPASHGGSHGIAAGSVAPFFVEQETPVPPGGLPQPGKLAVSLPDNHLQYALTWFGLALAWPEFS